MKRKGMSRAAWLGLSAALLGLDQLSKRWAVRSLKPVGARAWLPGVLGLRYAENTGAAFSAFAGATALLCVLSAAVCAVVLVCLLRRRPRGVILPLGLSAVLAGGLGNLIDRALRGYVIDFFEIQFMRFAIFNVADICVTVGAGLIFLALMLHGGDEDGRVDG